MQGMQGDMEYSESSYSYKKVFSLCSQFVPTLSPVAKQAKALHLGDVGFFVPTVPTVLQ